jgi:hypothetical protein
MKIRKQKEAREPRTLDELKVIAKQLHRNEIFTDRHCRSQQEIESCWPVLAMMDEDTRKSVLGTYVQQPTLRQKVWAKLTSKEIGPRYGLLYEDFGQRMPLGVNGLPMFFSVKILSPDERLTVEKFFDKLIKSEEKALR